MVWWVSTAAGGMTNDEQEPHKLSSRGSLGDREISGGSDAFLLPEIPQSASLPRDDGWALPFRHSSFAPSSLIRHSSIRHSSLPPHFPPRLPEPLPHDFFGRLALRRISLVLRPPVPRRPF